MKKIIFLTLFFIITFTNNIFSQNLSIEETLKYISDNSSTYFKVDSEGYISNERYKFHASEVSATAHMSSAVKIFCFSSQSGLYSLPRCIECLKNDCYSDGLERQHSTSELYINIDSSYDQKRLVNAINYLIKKVKEKYPMRGSNDPFAR